MSASAAAAETAPGLEARHVTLRHAGADRDSVRDVSLAVNPGEILALVGPNGSGKSTLLGALGGDVVPREGEVFLEGESLRRIAPRRLAQRVARLPQEPVGPEGLTVDSLVRQGRYPHLGAFGVARSDDERAIREAVRSMELGDLRARPLETLSGGERRRAWLGMVLAQETDYLLLDEPTAALDLRHQWELLEVLAGINRERGVTLVVSLHDLEQAASLAHRVAILHRGRLYHLGAPEQCLSEEMLRDVFAVDTRVHKEDGRLRIELRGPGDPIREM